MNQLFKRIKATAKYIMDQTVFGAADCIVFFSMITVSVGIGIFFACFKKGENSVSNYFLGNRRLKVVPVALSFVVSFQSSILIIGVPAESYAYGMQFTIQCLSCVIAYFIATIIFIPVFYPLKLTSVYEYFPKRFGDNKVRFLAVAFALAFQIFYSGVVVLGTALAITTVAGIPFWASVLLFSSAAVIYTTIGGIRAVVWTDVFQATIMLAGILAVLIKCSLAVGGGGNAFFIGRSRFNFLDFNPDPTKRHSFWSLFIGGVPTFLFVTTSQASVQRINSVPTIKGAKAMVYTAGFAFATSLFLASLEGVVVYAYFSNEGCDPIAAKLLKNLNQLIPFTVMELFAGIPGLPGLFISALAAASLSTISSSLNGMAAVTYEDIIKVYFPGTAEKSGTNISKACVVVFGVLAVGITFISSVINIPIVQTILTFVGAFGGPVNGIFLLSIFHHKATTKGVITGALCGIAITCWIVVGQNFSADVQKAPFLPLGPTGSCPTVSANSTMTVNTTTETSNMYLYTNELANVTTELIATDNHTYIDNLTKSLNKTEDATTSPSNSGLVGLYSISYMYFNLIGTVITIMVGVPISMLTQPKDPFDYDKQCVLPLSVFVPNCIAKRLLKLKKKNNRKDEKEAKCHELEIMVTEQNESDLQELK